MATRFFIQGNFGSLTTAKDLLRITAPTNGVMKLIECHVAQDTDETSEMLPFAVYRATDNGTGTAANIQTTDFNALISVGAFAGFSAGYNLTDTTKSPAAPILRESVNILSGFHFVPVPEARPNASGNARLVVRLETAPTNTLSVSVWAVVEIES